MEDLISRKAAIDALNINGCCGMGIQYIVDCDSVPAVQLDKLCEFLGKATQPCILLAIGCPYDETNCEECDPHDSWKAVLTKWMEEQDA